MKFILQSLGFILAKLPECVVSSLCSCVGWIIYAFPISRIRIAHSNISHSFPDMSLAERKKIALESSKRMVEMALFVLASPHIPNEDLRKRVQISANLLNELKKLAENPEPTVLMIPHFAMMETITMFPILVDMKTPRAGVFYRPFDNEGLESWVKFSRQRFGIEMISRKKGILHAVNFLREKGCVAVLFDQKILTGVRSLMLDRVCNSSQLAGTLAEHTKAGIGAFWATRTGFWRSCIDCVRLESGTVEDVTFAGDQWLSEKLRSDPIARYDWLWLHRRWQYVGDYKNILHLPESKSIINHILEKRGLVEMPRMTRLFVTTPDSLRDTIALLPLIRLLRKSRPDAFVSLLVQRKFAGIVEKFGVADEVVRLPNVEEGSLAKIFAYRRLNDRYADIHLIFSDSLLVDICSRLLQADYSFAVQTSRKRRFVTEVYRPDAAQSAEHIAIGYEAFLRRFGLKGDVDFSPLTLQNVESENSDDTNYVAVICGGEGSHAWTVQKWCALIKKLSLALDNAKFLVFGEESDSRTAFEIAKNAEFAEIENIAAKYDLEEAMAKILKCKLAIATDCAAAHIANALGVKTVAIYGATNPLRRGFVFNSPHIEILPNGCPIQGGGDSKGVDVDKLAGAAISFFNKSNQE